MHLRILKQAAIGDRLPSYTFEPGNCHTGISDWSGCTRCRLCLTRNRVAIFRKHKLAGTNHSDILILFIGEAPGELEDKTGQPFIGISGRIFEQYIRFTGIDFPYIITNTVGCRPVSVQYLDYEFEKEPVNSLDELIQDEDYELYDWNREPTKSEMEACRPHIDEIVTHYKPDGIVYLGKIAQNYGTRLPKLSLYHPAFIARQEYKLLPVLKEARKLRNFIHELREKKQ